MNYFNEWDKGAAAWLRELIKAGLIPNGYVDERSITEVTPSDLEGFTQCHFFAGIGGWSYALQLAGIPATTRLWTGSPPCQPFSVAGKQLGQLDERHLAPTFMRLVDQCRPPVLFGEQVAAAIGKHWLDDLFTELERQGYACGAAVLPAASVGAPHKRDRLFFGAVGNAAHVRFNRGGNAGQSGRDEHSDDGGACSMADSDYDRQQSGGRGGCSGESSGAWHDTGRYGKGCSMADTDNARSQGRGRVSERADQQPLGASGVASGLAQSDSEQQRQNTQTGKRNEDAAERRDEDSTAPAGLCRYNSANPHHSFWSDADWLGCRDGKFRPVEASAQQVVDGFSGGMGRGGDQSMRKAIEEIGFPLGTNIPARVARLRGYGNAIVPQCAAEFIKAFTGGQ